MLPIFPIIASPIAGYHSPIQPLLPPAMPQYTYNAQNINYAYTTAPPPINQYQQYQINPYQQAVHTPIQPSYIDNSNDQYAYQPQQQSVITYTNPMQIKSQQQQQLIQQKYANKKQNNFNRIYTITNNNNNNNNNNQKQNKNNNKKNKIQNQLHQSQPVIDNSNEKEWPSLVSDNKNIDLSKSDYDEDSDQKNEKENVIKEPYLKDEKKLKMLLKNVNFIKTAVEQHYLNENNIKVHNNNRNNFSFKDAILNPRSKIDNKPADNTNTEVKDNSLKKNSISSSQEPTKAKKNRKRSRSKKKTQNETNEKTTEENLSANFDLNDEDFPDLSASGSSNRPNSLSENWKKVDAHSNGNLNFKIN
jgi:hypothetical protein